MEEKVCGADGQIVVIVSLEFSLFSAKARRPRALSVLEVADDTKLARLVTGGDTSPLDLVLLAAKIRSVIPSGGLEC
jgi:hypothetical protein